MAKNLQTRLTRYLKSQGSPLAGHVPELIKAGKRYGVDPRLIVAISGAETSFGKAGQGPSVHNAWGIGPGRAYKSWGEGFNEMAKLLKTGYLSEGRTSFQSLYPKYVWGRSDRAGDPNADWVRNASAAYRALGGNPTNVAGGGWQGKLGPTGPAPASAKGMPKSISAGVPDLSQMPDFAGMSLSRIAQGGSAVGALRSLLSAPAHWAKTHPAVKPPQPTTNEPNARPRKPGQQGQDSIVTIKPNYSSLSLGKTIGTPHNGTHTLGNWQSDNAYDISIPVGTPIRADFDGVVGSNVGPIGGQSQSSSNRFAGSRVQIDGKGNSAWYGHLSRYVVKPGQRVKKGQIIGYSGSANGVPHLHVGYLHLPQR